VTDPGQYGDLLMVQTAVNEKTGLHGAAKQTWQDYRQVWGKMEPASATEQQKATGQVALSVFQFKTRYARDITEKMRGLWQNEGGRVMEFTGIRPSAAEGEMIIDMAGVRA
jgi:SPP1 family predicted phage head-tail adaptor